ncbi:MAG: hypothetical protein L0H73_01275 [Nitrococcus sp.]|nr:hypothetical protein [Nitrococcus sp.]
MPSSLRALVTDYLRTLIDLIEPFSPQLPLIAQALRRAGEAAGVVDLCSGGGGPWRHLSPQLNRLAGRVVPVLLTDKYPGQAASALRGASSAVVWCLTPVDATAVPGSLQGMRTLFDGFHHFTPTVATGILRNAVDDGAPIVVMELLRRSYADLLAVLFTPVLVWGLTPWIRPFSWTRLALTYVLPVAPLIIFWDTLVSVLRCYTPTELRRMGQVAAGNRYVWFADTYRYRGAPVTFLIGYPRDSAGAGGAAG